MRRHAIILLLALAITFSSHANTLLVPQQYSTIQMGVDAAVDGETVSLADGTYTGAGNKDIDFLGKAITVMSEGGSETCSSTVKERAGVSFSRKTRPIPLYCRDLQ